MFRPYKALLGLVASIVLALPAAAASSAIPGTLNYVEGQVAVAGQTVTSKSIGSVQMQPNQVVETGQGRAEVLLMPGVFLRIGDNSGARLISADLANTRVEVLHGQAIVEVAELFPQNNLWVSMNGASTRLDKQGLYAFNADTRLVQVFEGQATVQQNDRQLDLKKGREVTIGGPWKAAHFDPKSSATQGTLYAWSSLRSEYEAEASLQSARNIYVGGGAYWDGPGWYWNPYWAMYGFIPGDGIWYSPFGWPFYSPWVSYLAPGWGYGYGFRGGLARGLVVGHGHVAGNAAVANARFAGGAHIGGGGFGARGFAGGMHGGFGGGGHR